MFCSPGRLGLFVGLLALALQPCQACRKAVRHDASWQPDYVLVATAQNITLNCESRYSVTYNGTSPGPTLYMREGQTTWVRVYNGMTDQNVTTHWHGLSQRLAPLSDGTPLVSQWPTAPGEYFDYEVRPEFGDRGTYFLHSHVLLQALTAHGLVIVESAVNETEPYKYDADIPMGFYDFYRREDDDMVAGLHATPFQWVGEPDALLLNGHSGTASFSNASDATCQPYVFEVEPDKTYRLRFVGGTALSFVFVGIEDHSELTIIEADGQYTKPVTTDHIQLASGQRFSALLKTKSHEELFASGKSTFWVRYESRDRPTTVTGYALIRYKLPVADASSMALPKYMVPGADTNSMGLPKDLPSSPPVKLSTNLTEYTQWMEYRLESLVPDDTFPTLSEVTRTIYITMNQVIVDGNYTNGHISGNVQWNMNGLAWQEDVLARQNQAPYLINAYLTGQTPNYTAALENQGWDPVSKAFPARVGEVIEIVWLSNSGPTGGWDTHPMHLHGAHGWDLGSSNGTYDAAENEKRFANGYVPAKRDSLQVYRYAKTGVPHTTAGWRAFRLRITEENVGAWMMHCHILPHLVMGMMTVWVFGDIADILKEIPQPYISGYLDYGGSAYGNASFDPLVLHHSGGGS